MSANLPNIPGYDVEAELGRGGMGVVYRVRQQTTDAVLALKMILCGRDATFQELARFRIEAEAMACLNHPNIIKIRDVGVFSGYPFFALEFAEKGSLKHVMRGRPQPVRWSADLVKTLALALQHAHGRGMLHRDLKPANILVMGDGTPKISDFGLVKFAAPISKVSESCCTFPVSILDMELKRFAREFGAQYKSVADAPGISGEELTRRTWQECANRTGTLGDETKLQPVLEFLERAKHQSKATLCLDGLTHSGAVMGSPSYMAPEQALGELDRIGPHTDVYALGGILYELSTGRPPFSPNNIADIFTQVLSQPPRPPRQLEPTIPAELEAICLKCLQKDISQRYSRASDLVENLQRFLDRPASGADVSAVSPDTSVPELDDQGRVDRSPTESPLGDSRGKLTRTRTWWPFGSKSR
jgi:serine/threonine protein kinase